MSSSETYEIWRVQDWIGTRDTHRGMNFEKICTPFLFQHNTFGLAEKEANVYIKHILKNNDMLATHYDHIVILKSSQDILEIKDSYVDLHNLNNTRNNKKNISGIICGGMVVYTIFMTCALVRIISTSL